jgi:murein DD-endopeptidase MepM/ murein hydrolase activator NlpD
VTDKLIYFVLLYLTVGYSVNLEASENTDLLTLYGELTQGAMIVGHITSGDKVLLDDQELKLSPKGYFVFGFGRDDVNKHQLLVYKNKALLVTRDLNLKKRSYKIQKVNGISKKIMNPDPKAIKRAQDDAKLIRLKRQTDSDITAFASKFIAPSNGVITGVYGSQRIYNGVPKRPHFGLDYAGKTGDPVYAPAYGKVIMYVPDMFYSGGTMIIDHGHGVTSTFLHLSQSYVKTGDVVQQGQKVAAIGASGRATGPHLDWRVNWFDKRLDPALVLKIFP